MNVEHSLVAALEGTKGRQGDIETEADSAAVLYNNRGRAKRRNTAFDIFNHLFLVESCLIN